MKKKTELGGLHTEKLYMKSDDGRVAEMPVVTNICFHKDFKPYDKVLVKGKGKTGIIIWVPMLYSFFDTSTNTHILINLNGVNDNEIIPFDEEKAGKPVEDEK